MGWLLLTVLVLIAASGLWRRLAYWRWVRSIKDPKERMEAELLWRSWRKSRRH